MEAGPCAHQPPLQLCHVLYRHVIDSFLHHSPNAVINRMSVLSLVVMNLGVLRWSSSTVWHAWWASALP